MTQTTTPIALDELTEEQLQEMLDKKREKSRKEAEKKRQQYAKERNDIVMLLTTGAKQLSEMLASFKTDSFRELETFRQTMHEYANISSDNKGNFTIMNDEGTRKIEYRIQHKHAFNELANNAALHLRKFMGSFMKSRNQEAFELISSLLEKNTKGEYDIQLIQRLYKMEDRYTDTDWKEAIRLFKEAYQQQDSSSYVRYYERNASDGSWQMINLSFSKVPIKEEGVR